MAIDNDSMMGALGGYSRFEGAEPEARRYVLEEMDGDDERLHASSCDPEHCTCEDDR